MSTRRQPPAPVDRKPPSNADRPNQVDLGDSDRNVRKRRSGEGSDSALASWKSIERERKRVKPRDLNSDK